MFQYIMDVIPPSRYQVDGLCEIAISPTMIEVNVSCGLFGEAEVAEIINRVDELSHGKKSLVLINFSPCSRITVKGMKVLSGDRALNYAKAKAYVLRSMHQRFMAFIYILFKGKNKPVAFFGTRDKASEWLKELIIY